MTTQLVPVQDIEVMAQAVAKSGLFGLRTAEQAMALMLIAQAEGQHPAIAARDYHIIQGRPALRADAMLARFQAAGGAVRWVDYTDDKVTGVFSHPQGGEITVTWDMARAKKAGLGGKDNWMKFPRQMLRARCISEGVRSVYPGVVVGTYTEEEVEDMPPPKSHKEKVAAVEKVIEGERVEEPEKPKPKFGVQPGMIDDLLTKLGAAQSDGDLEALRLRIVELKEAKRISDAEASRLRAEFVARKAVVSKIEKARTIRAEMQDDGPKPVSEWIEEYEESMND